MEGLDNLLNVSADGLEGLFTKLSETLGVGVEFIQQNAIEYVLMYGKYTLVENVIFSFICVGAIIAFVLLVINLVMYCDGGLPKTKTNLKIFGYGIVFSAIVSIGDVAMYLASPEIYSIKQVMKLLSTQ